MEVINMFRENSSPDDMDFSYNFPTDVINLLFEDIEMNIIIAIIKKSMVLRLI